MNFLMTGFPGFLGSALLPLLLKDRPDAKALLLVQDKFEALARERLKQLEGRHLGLRDRAEVLVGDITLPGLGMKSFEGGSQIGEIFHLAAVYDLAMPRALGMRVNLEGTRRVLEFAQDCQSLKRFHYVSTCYVSGRYCGIFREQDLDKGQVFNNYYEETKFLAEVEVERAQRGGLPVTIYRPAIVVGDSTTGATQKYDGIYFLTGLLLRQPRWFSLVPVTGDPDACRLNLVPSDFVVRAIAYLSHLEISEGQVYQLADPEPLTVRELIGECARCTGRRPLQVPLPRGLTRWSLKHLEPLQRLVGIPAESVDYFVHPTHYTSDHTLRHLAGTDIQAPRLGSYLQTLVDFQIAHPEGALGPLV